MRPPGPGHGRAGKPPLLFLSPIPPALTGNGLAMRAGLVLEGLAGDHDVHLLVIPPVAGGPEEVPPELARRCARVALLRVADRPDPLFRLIERIQDPRERLAARLAYPRPFFCRGATADAVGEAARVVAGVAFREVHVFRLYLAPFAEPHLAASGPARPRCVLDLDELDSRTRRRVAALHAAAGNEAAAALETAEARKYRELERRYLPRFDRVYVCSAQEGRAAARAGARSVRVIPNGIRLPEPPATPAPQGAGPFTLLFVGNLGYAPNEDAARVLCTAVLPRLRALAGRPVRACLVGASPPARVRALAALPGVTVAADVEALGPWYAAADAVVVPLRAGGGTRIKILEAFAHRRPVVSTSAGAEGLAVRRGTHLLLADTAEGLARQCLRLLVAPALGARLAARAFDWVRARHGLDRVTALLRLDHAHAESARSRPRLRTAGRGSRAARRGSRSAARRPGPS